MTKVKLPREVANIIDQAKEQGGIERLVALIADKDPIGYRSYAPVMEIGLQTLMTALVNGYEVVETPEEKVRGYYRGIFDYSPKHPRMAVRETLDLIGIKIEGVNDK